MATSTTTTAPRHDQGADDDDYDQDLEDASAVIALHDVGDPSGYRLSNNPAAPYHRSVAVEQRGVVEVRCRARAIVHGRLGAGWTGEQGPFATLLVYDVHLDPTKRSQRITSAEVKFEFSSSRKGASGPEVVDVAPSSWMSSSLSTREETTTRGGELNVGAPEMVASVGGAAKYEKTVQQTTSDSASVVGSSWCDDHGKEITAQWRLFENETMRTGVPTFLRCAMMLARPSNGLFEAKITVQANLDWKTAVKNKFKFGGGNPPDDPVLFNPMLSTTTAASSRLCPEGFDVNNLGVVDVNKFVQILHATEFSPISSPLN
ncbi:hypothetical protein QBC39DRAFT_342297 [Podospora conica]|nr:hypothetical protein QBC39DRAFT_342297 [Schizothecium conicum]